MTGPGPDLFVCDNGRHLALALARMAARQRPSVLIFLEDAAPAPAALRRTVKHFDPRNEVHVTTDSSEIERFSRLPRWLPAILRRNLSVAWGRPIRPWNWCPDFLSNPAFAQGYFGHTGLFLAKSLAPRCKVRILVEAGLTNYRSHRVPFGKALLRALSGLPALRQSWGEEPWIDRIEAARPDELPAHLRVKAHLIDIGAEFGRLTEEDRQAIFRCFLDAPLELGRFRRPTALLLAQPLQDFGIGQQERSLLYSDLADVLLSHGFTVVLKPHPRDPGLRLRSIPTIPATLPAELLPYCADHVFDVAVAVRSTALGQGTERLARRAIQLAADVDFDSDHFQAWAKGARAALVAALAP